jgi:enoyl-CoA hydratase/carnithine racemase
MPCFEITVTDSIATITMARGKVNAINSEFVAELSGLLDEFETDSSTSALILTGRGKFFSFGLDIPELYDLSPAEMTRFIRTFCGLYHRLFLFPKPTVAAINGHAIAGGTILATACDARLMADGNGKMALNEITFGSTLFAGAVEMLRYCCGNRNIEKILLSGTMFTPAESLQLGLVDRIVTGDELMFASGQLAVEQSRHLSPAFTSLKRLARGPIAAEWMTREQQSILDWINVWYSPETRERARSVQIR